MDMIFQMADGKFYNASTGQSGSTYGSVTGGSTSGSYTTGTTGLASTVTLSPSGDSTYNPNTGQTTQGAQSAAQQAAQTAQYNPLLVDISQAGVAGSGVVLTENGAYTYQNPSNINSDVLQPSQSIDYNNVEEKDYTKTDVLPDYAELNSNVDKEGQMKMTAEEIKVQTLSEQIQKMQNELLGESLYRTEQESAQNIAGKTKDVNDLVIQYNILKNEAAAIPLQLQLNAKGQGITTAVLGRQENDRLRTNSIAALGIASLLETARGNLLTAQNLVDRAVAAKFDPIEEKIKVALANLQLIQNSPAYSLAEKNRAAKQQEIQDTKKYLTSQARSETQSIMDLAIKAVQNSGGDVAIGNAIQKAKSLLEANQIAGKLAYSTGWVYVSSPLERKKLEDSNKYEFMQTGGRTYARPSTEKYTTKNITVGSGKTAKEYLITYDSNGNETKRELLTGNSSNNNNNTSTPSKTEKEDKVLLFFNNFKGADGYVSPDDYVAARNAYVEDGGNATVFDTKFKGYKNPNNKNY